MMKVRIKKGDPCPFCRDACRTDCPVCSGSGFSMVNAEIERTRNAQGDFFADRLGADTKGLGGLIKSSLDLLFPDEEEKK